MASLSEGLTENWGAGFGEGVLPVGLLGAGPWQNQEGLCRHWGSPAFHTPTPSLSEAVPRAGAIQTGAQPTEGAVLTSPQPVLATLVCLGRGQVGPLV